MTPPSQPDQPEAICATVYGSALTEEHAVMRAAADYERVRAAYLALARVEDGHPVALAMVGADVERAHIALQGLAGVRSAPFSPVLRRVMRREVHRPADQGS